MTAVDLKQELINAEWRGWRTAVMRTNTGDVYTASRPGEVPIVADTEEELVRFITARDRQEGRLSD
jgi:hypothetical protein